MFENCVVYEGTQPILAELSTERVFGSYVVYEGSRTIVRLCYLSAKFESCAVYEGPNPTTGVQRKAISLRAERFTRTPKP